MTLSHAILFVAQGALFIYSAHLNRIFHRNAVAVMKLRDEAAVDLINARAAVETDVRHLFCLGCAGKVVAAIQARRAGAN
jgi:hypothetical protein